ncbi:putative phage abortive infection protein [Raoultella ornithinolytica]|uniref:putative phage abortive infection protein n=1 Tax=Raoultella ornithinolytica TaxID=54291 RepID=UPI00255A7CFD|nr:putative phage abortive infection protein [Raoultella ornithinolytica]MDL4584244.1 putative phage abortive infection protein [Raoultella ornithinolytica]
MRMGYIYTVSITTGLLTIIFLLYILEPTVFTDILTFITPIIGIASAAGAIIAAWATWQAAKEAAESAYIAKKSMEASDLSAKNTLQETQNFNRRSSFENRYALLLAQHDNYHRQVCDYIDAGRTKYSNGDKSILDNKEKKAICDFFEVNLLGSSLKPCMSFLTGHEIISRYMRTLYHLLKFVYSEFYYNENETESLRIMKNYTSPLRSTIRNDVLCMIAVNALNINSDSAKKSGYPHYQKLLHTFDFFEHAVFHSPFEPNIFGDENPETKIKNMIIYTQSKYTDKLFNSKEKIFKEPIIQRLSPTTLCLLIYNNPMKSITQTALSTIFDRIKPTLENKLSELIDMYEESVMVTKSINRYSTTHDSDTLKIKITPKILNDFLSDAQENARRPFKSYMFYAPENFKINIFDGETIHYHFETIFRYEGLFQELQRSGSMSGLLDYKHRQHDKSLDDFYSQIQEYSVIQM